MSILLTEGLFYKYLPLILKTRLKKCPPIFPAYIKQEKESSALYVCVCVRKYEALTELCFT